MMDTQELLNVLWILFAAILVLLMQAGFMCLESGLTRAKNSINVAIKNVTDFSLSFFIFWLLGYGLMFGISKTGWLGVSQFALPFEENAWDAAFFFFQAMFCATAATILSGAVAERMRYLSYVWVTALISGLVYPVYGHWVWNSAEGGVGGWLYQKGFVDFAGSTVVHSVGGWASLAALILIGARAGRFLPDGTVQRINGSNLPMSVLGAILLIIGWFGFNGGSTLALNSDVPHIIANTALAAATGSLATLAVGAFIRKRPDVDLIINGALAGLVAITANCHAVTANESVIIGAIGGWCMLACERLMLRFRIDDAVGAVPVHLAAGIWGTLAVALFGDPEILGTGLSFEAQLVVQAQGVAAAGLWAFTLTFIILFLINKIFPLRVTPHEEEVGLNVAEHGASTELIDLLNAMTDHGRSGDLSGRLKIEPFTEVGQIARRYNQVMDMLQRAVTRADTIVRDIQDGIITFAANGAITSLNPSAERIFGLQAQALQRQPVTMLFAGGDGASLPLTTLLRLGTAESGAELQARRGDQSRFDAELKISASQLGEDMLYTGLVKDISQRKEAENALKQNREMVQRHNRALAELASTKHVGLTLEETLGLIAKAATTTLHLQRLSLWRLRNKSKVLALDWLYDADYGRSAFGDDTRITVKLDQMPTFHEAIFELTVIAAGEAAQDIRTRSLWTQYLGPQQVEALLCVQLKLSGQLWGVILFEDTRAPRAWAPEEELFASAVSKHIALVFEEQQRKDAEAALQRMNQELENRVAERTSALQHSYEELRDAMNALQQTQRQLVQSEKMAALGELVAGVAHEINTPVGVAVTAASHLEDKCKKFALAFEENQMKRSDLSAFIQVSKETSAMLLANLTRASDLVQSFKKVAVDQSSEAIRDFNLKAYVEEILLSLRPKLKKTRHEIVLECPEDTVLHTYAGAFSQVVTNLIVNSLVHGFENEDAAGRITMRFCPEDDILFFEYGDTGKGIPPEVLPRIFDPFFTTKRGSGGSGLGLHLLYNLVTGTLGGTVECSSSPGEGAVFLIRMPRERKEDKS